MSSRPTFLLLAAAAAGALLTGGAPLQAAEDPFVGRWKFNLAKSTVTGFQLKIEDAGNGQFTFTFGDDVDTLIIDGQEHPTRYGSRRTITQVGPRHWQSVYRREGTVTGTDEWSVSEDERTLDYHIEGTRADGSHYQQTYKNKRVAGTSGQVGVWESTEVDPDAYPDWVIEAFGGGDGLVFVAPANQERRPNQFDGQDYPNEGPRVAPGATTAGRRLDGRTLELTDKLQGKVLDTQRLELSADGKTLTLTMTYPGVEKKEVDVYERQP